MRRVLRLLTAAAAAALATANAPASAAPRARPTFGTRDDVVAFVLAQRAAGGAGLPSTFAGVPPGPVRGSDVTGRYLRESSLLYDTSLAVLHLVETGRLAEAREILDVYASGTHGTMALRAYPTPDNGGAFAPLDADAYLLFKATRASGVWDPSWFFYEVDAGSNAFLVLAVARYVDATQDASLLPFAKAVADGLIRLQDEAALGAVRRGPRGQYHPSGNPDAVFDSVSTENVLSAYAAFRELARVGGGDAYADAADRIEAWLRTAPLRAPSGAPHVGVLDATTSTFHSGAELVGGEWRLSDAFAADAAGTWALSSLGAEFLDATWGAGTSLSMWDAVRARCGRTATFGLAGPGDAVASLDFTDRVDGAAVVPTTALGSPEWTAGGVHALDEILSRATPSRTDGARLRRDRGTLLRFLRAGTGSYALGPGLGIPRDGATGFGWQAPPAEVVTTAATYRFLDGSPLARWRRVVDLGRANSTYTDGRAFAETLVGPFDLSRAATVRLVFDPADVGTRFVARLLPAGRDPNFPTGLLRRVLRVPETGVVEIPLRWFPVSGRSLRAIAQVSVHSGTSAWRQSLRQGAGRTLSDTLVQVVERN